MDPFTLLAAAALAGTATSVYQGEQQRSAQRKAGEQAKQDATKAAAQQTRETNAVNARAPNVGALLSANQQAAAGGGASLTGPGGIDPNLLTLGRPSLLGGGG
jgi:hypothetical protein